MKTTPFLIAITCFIAGIFAATLPTREPAAVARSAHLLGAKECTWGPSYWCKNLTTASSCHAVKHCIQTVWEHQTLPPDHSSICETCLEMVKEARDQLESNETQEEIKEVFEGSCRLIPIKFVAKGCIKLADEFIVELVDTLASQMNPQIVCSVAGLCNNERIHQALAESATTNSGISTTSPKSKSGDHCAGCHTVIDLVERKFRQANRDTVLQNFLQVCGRMGSLSDACSNIVVTYFNEIYRHLQENLNPTDFCLMAGECSAMFHTHAKVEITPLSNVGVVPVREHDNLPCDFCKQLVHHLQDILVANTTEDEFHTVLLGICKQTKSFKDECTNIVNEYYPIIYDFLVNELNGTVICSMIGICPGAGLELDDNAPIIPLLPMETVQNPLLTAHPITPVSRVSLHKGGSSVQILSPSDLEMSPELAQLPIERLVPQTLTMVGNTKMCVFCEYFLHFVQEAITDPKTEESIKHVVDRACDILPRSVNETCREFVDTYGAAFIAILAQDIDPSTVCPRLSLCPSSEAHNVEVFLDKNNGEKPNCPLCLFAVTSLQNLIKDERTETKIRKELSTLCSHLSDNLAKVCNDFVETYSNEIVEACLAQLTPQEVCVYLRLCEDKTPPHVSLPKVELGGHVLTNEIPDPTINGKLVPKGEKDSGACVLCEFIMTQLSKELKDKTTDDEIKKAVHGICNHLPKSVSKECNSFVDQYADAVIQLLIESMDPSQVCKELKFCDKTQQIDNYLDTIENVGSPQCSLCKIIMNQIEKLLEGKVTEDEVIKAVHNVCSLLPSSSKKECNDFIDKYGPKIIELLEAAVQPGEICSILMFCSTEMDTVRLEVRQCSVCESAVDVMDKILENPNVDHSLEHVLEKTCRALPSKYQTTCRDMIDEYGDRLFKELAEAADPSFVCHKVGLCGARITRPPRDTLLGANKCTWGPGYWCLSEDNANECGAGAKQHCQEKVWLQEKPPK